MRKLLVLCVLALFTSTLTKAQVSEQEMDLIGSILKSRA